MLVLSRKEQETLIIDGNIKVVVLHVSSRGVRIGIEAPPHVAIHRGEVRDRINAERQRSVDVEHVEHVEQDVGQDAA